MLKTTMVKMLKSLLICTFLITSFLLLFSNKNVYASFATSTCVVTKIGNPAGDPKLPAACVTKKEFVYYCQNDYSYCDIAASGCGPTSFAMIVSTFGVPTTPPQAADLYKSVGARSCGSGSVTPTALAALLPSRGFTYRQILSNPGVGVANASAPRPALNLSKAKEFLDAGYLIMGSTEGHIFVVDNVDVSKNQVHMQDPAGPGCRTRDQGGYWSNNNFPWLGHSWYYAYVIKKE